MPAAYITGQATFLGRAFNVSQAVMIPRLSSQTLVHAAVRWHHRKDGSASQGCRVLDLGTGSGCLLLSALKELSASISPIPAQTMQPQTVVGVGIDLSSEALEVARSNAERLDLVPQVHFLEASFGDLATVADLSSRLLQEGGCAGGSESTAVPFAGFDVIVCNPPYSSESEVDRIDWQPRAFEPHLAIFTARGTGKLSAYKAIAESMACCFESAGEASPRILCPGGVLVVEVGNGQADAVTAIFCDGPWGVFQLEEACKDLHGLVRALVFRQMKCNAT
jgi:release factor glutamine methyltransferase